MSETTCWTLIEAAASGDQDGEQRFARRYLPVVSAYVSARWRGSARAAEAEDAVQEVFLECLREGGVLAKAEERRSGGFRAFLYGVTRNVTARIEERIRRRRTDALDSAVEGQELCHEEATLGAAFDRAWAQDLVRRAGLQMAENAKSRGADSVLCLELLRERFQGGRPIRDIATSWRMDPARVHTLYARARREFAAALREVVAFNHPEDPEGVERECRALLESLAS